jgi:hypothetical protein
MADVPVDPCVLDPAALQVEPGAQSLALFPRQT